MTPNLRPVVLVLMAVLVVPMALQAQMKPFVMLEKAGTNKRIRYYVGDEIRFKTTGDDTVHSGVLTGLNDSVFFLAKEVGVKFDRVETVVLPRGRGSFKNIGGQAFYAIPAILVISAANNLFNTGDTPVIDDAAWGVSGVFGAIGLVSLTIPEDKTHHLKNRWRLIPVIH